MKQIIYILAGMPLMFSLMSLLFLRIASKDLFRKVFSNVNWGKFITRGGIMIALFYWGVSNYMNL